ncbi:MAG: hypothetical protein Kow0099_13460 [Candidatus Abyssubacteria bacterium]
MVTIKGFMQKLEGPPHAGSGYMVAAICLALLVFLAWPGFAGAQDYPAAASQPPVSQEDPSNVARLSVAEADSYILGKDDVDWSVAEPNLIIEQGDLLQTNETGKAEIQFEPGMTVRIGEATRIAVVEMGNNKVIGIDSGKAYLRLSKDLPEGKSFVLTFPAGELIAVHEALVRIDVLENGDAEIKVIRGRVGIETRSESAKLVGTGEKVLVSSNGWIEYTDYDMARRDDFDAWNEERDIILSAYDTPKQLKKDLVGAEDLNGYGEWVQSDRYGQQAWKPYVAEDWRPYYYGRWYYSDYYGWTWVPVEPWGYVTYHYGSWNYDPYYGWIWVPGYVWRPHYVQWVTYDPYIGWAPIGYYGYPVITTYPYYVTNFHTGFFDVFSFSFVFYDDFHHHHVHDHFYHHDSIVHIDKDVDIDIDIDRDIHIGRDGVREHLKGDHRQLHRDYAQVREDYIRARRDYKTVRSRIKDRRPSEIMAERLKNAKGKPQFVKNLQDQGFFKGADFKNALHKGSLDRGRIDVEKVFAVDKRPELRKQIAKLEKNDLRFASLKNDSAVNLPKKVDRDKVKSLDFRALDKKGTSNTADRVRKRMQSRTDSPRSIVADNRDLRNMATKPTDRAQALASNQENRSRIINQLREDQPRRIESAQANRRTADQAARQHQVERVREAMRSSEPVRERAVQRGIEREQVRSRTTEPQRLRSVEREQLRSVEQGRVRTADTERFREQMRTLDQKQMQDRVDAMRNRLEAPRAPAAVERVRTQDLRRNSPQRLDRLPPSSLNRGRDIPQTSRNSFRDAAPAQAPRLRSEQFDNAGRFNRVPTPAARTIDRSGPASRFQQIERAPTPGAAAPKINRAPARIQQSANSSRVQSSPQIRANSGRDFSGNRGAIRSAIRTNRANRR